MDRWKGGEKTGKERWKERDKKGRSGEEGERKERNGWWMQERVKSLISIVLCWFTCAK